MYSQVEFFFSTQLCIVQWKNESVLIAFIGIKSQVWASLQASMFCYASLNKV